ncbi:MAG TPA: hypothetical protein VD887_04910 [Allosphingosinicella sp.]|jgi:hypothetical protein|nr:hypothetical protein [Allosphingosinicella sp.]
MKLSSLLGGLAAAGLLAAPAAAQKPDDRTGRVAGEIARQIEDAADAVGTVGDAVAGSLGRIRYRGAERFAIGRCAPRVERYGRMRVEQVAPYGRRSLRVYGTTEGGTSYDRGAGQRAFACTVRDDGRVRLSTRRLG